MNLSGVLSSDMITKPVLVFDFDGTISDSVAVMIDIITELASKYGFKNINDIGLAEFRKMGTEKMIEVLEIPGGFLNKVMEGIGQELSNKADVIKPVEGMAGVLKTLKQRGYRLLIVTTNKKENVEKLINNYQMAYFDGIYPDAGLHGKSGSLLGLILDNGVAGSDVVYIGDETRDIEAGKACGCKTMAVGWGLNGKEALETKNPDWVVDKPTDMLEVFQ